MRWSRLAEISTTVDETSGEWEELWVVKGFIPPDSEPPWIGLLNDRPQFRPGQPHYNPAVLAKVATFQADALGSTPDGWEVAVRYRSELAEREQNPLARPAEIDLDSESEEVPIDRDADGRAILSSAGGLIVGLTEEQNRWIFNVAKNVPVVPAIFLAYRNAVNIDAVRVAGLSIPPGHLLLKNPRAGKPQRVVVRGSEIVYRELTFSLVFHPETWITRYYDRDLYELQEIEVEVPDPDAPDEGATKVVKTIQRVRITTQNEQGEDVEVDEPQFLDGNGRRPRNPDGSIKAPLEPSDLVTKEVWKKRRLPFRALPLT